MANPTLPPDWVGEYIGLPWKEQGRDRNGLDCWGLLRLVLSERHGIEIPEWGGVGYQGRDNKRREASERRELGRFMKAHAQDWTEITVPAARGGDGLLMRSGRHPIHVGVFVGPMWLLHIESKADSVLVDLTSNSLLCQNIRNRIIGAYRHRELME